MTTWFGHVAQTNQLQSRQVRPGYYRVPSLLLRTAPQQDEDAHIKGTQVSTENRFQDFSGLFPALSWLVFLFDFKRVTPHIPLWILRRVQPWAHLYTHAHAHACSDYLTALQEERGTVTQQYVLSTYFMSLRPFRTVTTHTGSLVPQSVVLRDSLSDVVLHTCS